MINGRMQIYLAHNFAARASLVGILDCLAADGIDVTSRWIVDDEHVKEGSAEQNAVADIEDIEKADAVVLFVDQYGDRPGRGKWFEFGYAVALRIPVMLIGVDTNCVFYHLPSDEFNIYRFENLDDGVQALKSLATAMAADEAGVIQVTND